MPAGASTQVRGVRSSLCSLGASECVREKDLHKSLQKSEVAPPWRHKSEGRKPPLTCTFVVEARRIEPPEPLACYALPARSRKSGTVRFPH